MRANLDNDFFHNHIAFGTIHLMQVVSFWKPRYIPSANTLDIPHHKFKAFEVECCDSIEADIEKNQGPLKEGVFGVC
jgi:hypothetical protein